MSSACLLVRGGIDVHGARCDVLVTDGAIAALDSSVAAPRGTSLLDAEGLVVSAGLVDLQVNGAAGIDITTEPERLWEVAGELARCGVTAFLPTIISSPPRIRDRALNALRTRAGNPPRGAVPLGMHFEGPMLAPARKGAHPEQWLAPPAPELVAGWSRQEGIRMVTIAPELPGALAVIKELVARDVVVSVGHTAATTEDIRAAVAAGASCVTHLFNAMPPLGHREPGLVGVALGDEDLVAGVIVDGHHVDPLAVTVAWRALGPTRFLTVSDTTAALGMDDGGVMLGTNEVVVAHGTVRLNDGTLAGSAASLSDCLQVLLQVTGCSLTDALATATTTPCRLLGEPNRGRLDLGCRGDLVLFEHDAAQASLRPVVTVVAGEIVHDQRVDGPVKMSER